VYCKDTEGNVFGLMENDASAGSGMSSPAK